MSKWSYEKYEGVEQLTPDKASRLTAFDSLDQVLSLEEAESFGFDATGRDLDTRFPYTLRDALRKQLAAVAEHEMCAEPLCAEMPVKDGSECDFLPLCRVHLDEMLDEIANPQITVSASDEAPFYSGYEG